MKKDRKFKRIIGTVSSFFIFFIIAAFVTTCCIMLFVSILQGSIGRQFTREEITLALEMTVPPEATVEEQNRAARSVIESCVFDKTACTLSVTYRFAV